MNKNTYYVTTPIYYVTAKPHLGSLYSTLLADVLARWNKKQGKDVFFLTGTDEHGQKVAQAAQKAGESPKNFVDQFIPAYKYVWQKFDIDYSHFIRTTDEQHKIAVQKIIEQLLDQGDVYKGEYQGWYCTPCETFVTEKEFEKDDPKCPSCKREITQVSESTYFFRLSKYEQQLLDFYKNNPDFISPKERSNEVIRFVESGLRDISISRTTVKWGVPFPGDQEHVLYVWIEALCNYITGIGYKQSTERFNKFWPANTHVMGKDIVRFHAVYWTAMLLALKLSLPKQLLVHGWITVDEQKMSKSLGNIVDPMKLADAYGVDQVRYYLVRQLPISQDGNFSTGDLEQRITSELANDLGNLLQRTVTLAYKYDLKIVSAPNSFSDASRELHAALIETVKNFTKHMKNNQFHVSLNVLWSYIGKVNSYFHNQEPWKQVKTNQKLFAQTISVTVHSLHAIAHLLLPIMPNKMKVLLERLGKGDSVNIIFDELALTSWNKEFSLSAGDALFVKFDKPEQAKEKIEDKIMQSAFAKQPLLKLRRSRATSDEPKGSEMETGYVKFDDFVKVEIRVGTIKECEEIEDSEKLLKLQVDFGKFGIKQIVSGIKQWYIPSDLIAKQAVFAFNLKPRKIFGLESNGMIMLATDVDGKPQLVSPVSQVESGTLLK